MAPVDVTVEEVIRRPRHEVAAYASDPDNATAWYGHIKAVRWLTPRPLELGSEFEFTATFLGRTLVYTYEVVVFVPNRRLTMATGQGPFPMQTAYEWHDAPNHSTRMTLRNQGHPSGFSRFFTPVMGVAIQRATTTDLARLKALLES